MVDSFADDMLNEELDEEYGSEDLSNVRSTIGPDVLMEGEMVLRNGIEINGTYKGSIISNSKVRVLEKGHLEGDVDAFHVIVEGKSRSKMHARKRLEILKGGRFVGQLETQPEVIVISEFASFGRTEKVADEFAKEFVRDRADEPNEKPGQDSKNKKKK